MKDPKAPKAAARKTTRSAWLQSRTFKIALTVFLCGMITTSAVVLYYYNYYSGILDRRISGEAFKHTARIYASPYYLYPGQKLAADSVVARLQRAGFEPAGAANVDEGIYEVAANRITIKPTAGQPLRLDFQKGSLSRIVKGNGTDVAEAYLPPELVTNLFDQSREKRRIVVFNELPKDLVNALIAAEDRRFYSHWGFDPIRTVGAVVQSIRDSQRVQGTSTITQQFAKNFFLTPDRSLKRKLNELFVAIMLEQRLSKQEILTLYSNEVYMGRRGSFDIHGFGEAAAAYFGKDLTGLTLPEAATLVAMIHSPNGIGSPTKHPAEVKNRRNSILNTMVELGSINRAEADAAKKTELLVTPVKIDASDAPYLVDYIQDQLVKDFPEDDLINNSLRVYTTLDPALQKAAFDAVVKGLKQVNDQIARRDKGRKNLPKRPPVQAAMIALNPKTGGIYAMVGGSDYALTQLNRITHAFRQPGSIFKPFVYAAAMETAEAAVHPEETPEPLTENTTASPEPAPVPEAAALPAEALPVDLEQEIITPITMLTDEPTVFLYDGTRTYEPNNYHAQYRGTVTVREALEHSLNVPTIKLAERIGYDRVARLARRAGLNEKIKGYPSIALGAFEVTPIEMAGAYTVFANEGKRLEPHALLSVLDADGKVAKAYKYPETPVLSPQVTYVMTHLMEGVVDSGTAAGVRAAGFSLPAAGKTGTSRDGWFAGYTKDFLAIAWVGYDDNSDLNLEGAHSALPIWTDFMMKAAALYPPRDLDRMYFSPPEGVDFARIDAQSHLPATAGCPDTYEESFLSGTIPKTMCPLHGGVISALLDSGVSATGRAARGVFGGLGRIFGDLFGGKK